MREGSARKHSGRMIAEPSGPDFIRMFIGIVLLPFLLRHHESMLIPDRRP